MRGGRSCLLGTANVASAPYNRVSGAWEHREGTVPFEGVAMLCEGGCNALRGVQCSIGYVIRCAMLWGGCNALWGVQCSGRVQCPTRGGGSGDFHVPNVPHVPTGFERVQSFRKSDGSYGAWLHRGSSTW